MSDTTIKDLIAWCDRKTAEGHILAFEWDGGGDDGWLHLSIGDNEPEAAKLIDLMHHQIGYGWWNGELSASGSAQYDPQSHMFRGIHSENAVIDVVLETYKLQIRGDLNFEWIYIHILDDYSIEVEFTGDGNLDTVAHQEIRETLKKDLPPLIKGAVQSFDGNIKQLMSYTFDKDLFEINGDFLELGIDWLTVDATVEKEVELNLLELLGRKHIG